MEKALRFTTIFFAIILILSLFANAICDIFKYNQYMPICGYVFFGSFLAICFCMVGWAVINKTNKL